MLAQLEADRRAINITLNSLSEPTVIKVRDQLYPTVGKLYPSATGLCEKKNLAYVSKLAQCVDVDSVRNAIDAFPVRPALPQPARRTSRPFLAKE